MPVRSNLRASFKVQLADWIMPPSIWFAMPSGLIARPASTRPRAGDTHNAADAVDLNLGDHCAIARMVLVSRESDPAPPECAAGAAAAVAHGARSPAALSGRRFDHRPRALVAQVSQTKFHGVGARRRAGLVHERFDREDVCI